MRVLTLIRFLIYKIYNLTHRWILRYFYGMDIGKNAKISRKAELDYSNNPRGIHIGDNTYVTGGVIIMTHDHVRALKTDTYIGKNCFLGANCIILPGVKVGDHVVVGTGSVVTHDVPSHSIVVGNPAKIIKSGITLKDNGQIVTN